jgi:hypothetical protein
VSGATGAGEGGRGAEQSDTSGPATATGGARGLAREHGGPHGGAPQVESHGGGTTVTDASQPQQYHPPQAYPSPETAGPLGGASGGRVAQQGVRRPRPAARTAPRTRKARLRVAKADPWSVMKVSFLLSIALGICTVVAVALLWMVMDAMGVFSAVGGTVSEATSSSTSNGFDLEAFLSLPRVLGFASVIAVIDVVLATALATLGAFIYNISAGFVGGVELTLAEDE